MDRRDRSERPVSRDYRLGIYRGAYRAMVDTNYTGKGSARLVEFFKEVEPGDAKFFLILLIFWVWLAGPGNLEGQFFPTVRPLTISDATHADRSGWMVFSGETMRLRVGCSFERTEWYLGDRNGQHVPVPVLMSEPEVRDTGVPLRLDSWAVQLRSKFQLLNNSYADVIHTCSVFHSVVDGKKVGGMELPWETRTVFWN